MRSRILFFVAILVVASLGCSTLFNDGGDTPDVVDTPDVGVAPDVVDTPDLVDTPDVGGQSGGGDSGGGQTLFEDDFSDTSTGWEVGDYDTGTVGYKGGTYSVVAFGDGDTMWGLANRSFDDTDVEVRAEQVSAPSNDNNDYGVMCRVQTNSDGYFLLISGDGFYTILKRSNEAFTPLIDWTQSSLIRLGNTSNDIRAVCDGSTLSLYVNGQLLGSTSDSEFSQGDLALTATSYETESTEVLFDNIVVTRP
jgi:hypothetical protein